MLLFLLYLAIFGFVVWLIVTYIPMPPPIKNVIIAIAVIALILWLISSLGGSDFLARPLVIPRR